MSKNISKIIETLITECECDARIESGIFDVYNSDHLIVLSEHMADYGLSEEIVENAIEAMSIDEGKYPDRQAFNKEGWLVTFPSKEYRDAAIKKRTHFTSDPTHGKGGMNLYYKKKGKQKRQKSQTVSSTEKPADQQVAPSQATPKGPQPSAQGEKPIDGTAETPQSKSQDAEKPSSVGSKTGGAEKIEPSADQTPSSPQAAADATPDVATKPSEAPAIDVPVVTPPPQQYADISKKFATKKNWQSTPYGEYHDAEGTPVAVVGLTGEIVPIRSTDREEYKIFAEKNMPV